MHIQTSQETCCTQALDVILPTMIEDMYDLNIFFIFPQLVTNALFCTTTHLIKFSCMHIGKNAFALHFCYFIKATLKEALSAALDARRKG